MVNLYADKNDRITELSYMTFIVHAQFFYRADMSKYKIWYKEVKYLKQIDFVYIYKKKKINKYNRVVISY